MLQHQYLGPKRPPRVVVVGAAGFVGAALVHKLASRDISVLALGRRDIDLLTSDAGARLATRLRPDDVLVAAAARAPCKNIQMFVENMKIVVALVEALVRSPVAHVVNISSDAVYADSADPLTEESILAPDTLHGAMHLARELALRQEVRTPLTMLRPSLLYGAADPHNGYGPNRFRRLANDGKDIILFGEGEERRDHVLIDDVAEIAARVIERRSVGSLNIATGNVHSFREVAELVVANSPNKVAIKGSPRLGPMPHNGYRPFNNSSSRAAFPDFHYVSLANGIAKSQRDQSVAL
jgi:nucleoside-diphosphate-sugar epimerase